MNILLPVTASPAAPLPPVRDPAAAILAAANLLLPHLERGQPIDTAMLRTAMESAFGASDASGAWDWKAAYEAGEVATVLFLRKYGKALFRKAASPAARLCVLTKVLALVPTHTRRSEESQALQQFSTPVPLGLAALTAAAITPADRVLEPSAGTGLLAILAETAGASLILNELADTRADLLSSLFPALAVTRFDAAQVHDHLDPAVVPSVVLMNPPFSAMRTSPAALRMRASATSPPRWRVSPMAAASSRSPARTSARTCRTGETPSSASRHGAASSSPRRSPARFMPSTARLSRRASPSSTRCLPTIPPCFRPRRAWRPTSRRCSAGSRRMCRCACLSPYRRSRWRHRPRRAA